VIHDFDRVIDRRGTESSKWHTYPPDVLPLWVADMDFRSPEPVIRALRERVEHGVFGYGVEQSEFYEVFLDRLQTRYGWRVSPEAILVIPGVIPGFNLAARALTTTGDGLLLQTPVYPPIRRVPGNVGLTSDEMELERQPDGRYAIDFERFEAAIGERTRMFLLCNPHNPVGRVFRREELQRMAEICVRRGLLICADEVHCELTFSRQQHVPIASLDAAIAARTITLMAPSKSFNLPGLKCAVAIIPNASLREKFVAARSTWCGPSTSSATPPPSLPTATASRGSTRSCGTWRPTATSWSSPCGRSCPASARPRRRRPIWPGSIAARPTCRTATRTHSSSTRRESR